MGQIDGIKRIGEIFIDVLNLLKSKIYKDFLQLFSTNLDQFFKTVSREWTMIHENFPPCYALHISRVI